MSAQSTPTGATSYSDRLPTSAELDRYLQQLEQNLSDSLVRCSNKQPKSNASVSFDLSGDSLWRPRQETSQRTQQFRQPQSGPRGEHQEYLTTPSDEEQHHQLTGDGARQLTSPQPTSSQLQPVAEGTLELLLRQMQKDREASNRNMESLVQALASNTQRKACMDAIPQCPQMQHKEDIVEYLQVFEETQLARGNPKEHWCHTLIPLLNKNCKAVVVGLPPSTKYNYKLLKAELLATASHKYRQSSKDFWEHEKKSGSTWREVANALIKKIRLFTPGPTPEDVRNQVATEKLIQLLPFKAQAFVREREPKTVTEAADLASSYFYSHNMDESHWETHIYKHKPANIKDSFKEKQQNYSHQQHQSKPYHPNQHHSQQTHKSHNSHDQHQTQSTNSFTNSSSKEGHSHPNQQGHGSRNYQNFNKGDPSKVTCIKCGERGHKADACLKINLVNIPCLFGSFTTPPILKPGKIDGKPVQLFMDSGADSAIIAKEMLPPKYIQCMPVNVTGVNSQDTPKLCQTALFPAQIDGHDVQMFAAVADGKDLPHPFIVGRLVPGLDITWDINISKPGTKEQTGEAGERVSQVIHESALDPAVSKHQPPEWTVPAEIPSPAQQGNFYREPPLTKLQSTQSTPPTSSKILDLENFTAADIAIVRTRAQAKREQQQQQQDDAATALSTTPITSPEDIPDLDDTNLADRPSKVSQDINNHSTLHLADMPTSPLETSLDPESSPLGRELIDSSNPSPFKDVPHSADRPGSVADETISQQTNSQIQPDYTIITSPFSSADLIREQKADTSLKPLWDAAADPLQTEFVQKDSILYAVNLEQKPNENPYKIVVPTPLRPKVLNIGHACSGHFGSKKTKAHIEAHFYWPGIGRDIQKHCKACKTCAQFNSHKLDIQPLKPVSLVHTP